MSDLIRREDAIKAILDLPNCPDGYSDTYDKAYIISELEEVPSVPISQEYAKAIFAWLLDYQIKCAELKGKYSPYEVLSWVVNDWRRENEIG